MAVHAVPRSSNNDSSHLFVLRVKARASVDEEQGGVQLKVRDDRLQRLPSAVQHVALCAGVQSQERRTVLAQPHLQEPGSQQGVSGRRKLT